MTRQIVLDTETTGLEPEAGHRIIEIGAVELINRRESGRTLHFYLNPDRDIDEAAIEVHGITIDQLLDKPRFAEVVDEFVEFVTDAELVIHNAPFDVGFLNHELSLLKTPPGRIEELCTIEDTLVMARRMYPGQRNSLDALCKRLEVDNSGRVLHGALLDAQILADVYLRMTGGQTSFFGEEQAYDPADAVAAGPAGGATAAVYRTAMEQEARGHEQWLDRLAGEIETAPLWRRLEQGD